VQERLPRSTRRDDFERSLHQQAVQLEPYRRRFVADCSSARSPCDTTALVSNIGNSKRRDFIQGCEMDVADV
jgi:hypothetical protein